MSDTPLQLAALFTIFEKHLYDVDSQDDNETQAEFIDKIVQDYLKYLRTSGVAVPARWQRHITEELRNQVYNMLVKKTYGCLSIEEFLGKQGNAKEKRKETKKKFSKLF